MPRLRQTPREIADSNFRAALAAGMAKERLTKGEVADKLHISMQTLRNYTEAPNGVRLEHIRKLVSLGVISADDLASFLVI